MARCARARRRACEAHVRGLRGIVPRFPRALGRLWTPASPALSPRGGRRPTSASAAGFPPRPHGACPGSGGSSEARAPSPRRARSALHSGSRRRQNSPHNFTRIGGVGPLSCGSGSWLGRQGCGCGWGARTPGARASAHAGCWLPRAEVGTRGPGGAEATRPEGLPRPPGRGGTRRCGRPWPNGGLWSVTLSGNFLHDSLAKVPLRPHPSASIFWGSFYLLNNLIGA